MQAEIEVPAEHKAHAADYLDGYRSSLANPGESIGNNPHRANDINLPFSVVSKPWPAKSAWDAGFHQGYLEWLST